MKNTKKILFVCTGNTCRSYMAEIIAREYLGNTDDRNRIEVLSAGTGCMGGEPATIQAAAVLAELGYTELDHCARELNGDLITSADLILTMTEHQKRQVLREYPQAGNKVFLLKEYACAKDSREDLKIQADPSYYDIADPFGQSLEYYRDCGAELKMAVEQAIDKVRDVKYL